MFVVVVYQRKIEAYSTADYVTKNILKHFVVKGSFSLTTKILLRKGVDRKSFGLPPGQAVLTVTPSTIRS